MGRIENTKIDLNTSSSRNNIPEIEHQIHVINDRLKNCRHTLPFKHIYNLIIVAMLINCKMWIKKFPQKGGDYASVIPLTILLGVKFDYNEHLQLQFVQCAKVQQEINPTNRQASRTFIICVISYIKYLPPTLFNEQ